MSNKFPGKVGFAIGTGRCGTTFLYRVMSEEPNIAASHERNHLLESFHKYCSWNELPVDEEGFLAEKEREINEDLGWAEFSFESSGHLSFSVPALSGRFQARFVLLVRNPLRVVSSYVHKGYYEQPFRQQKTDLALGFQPGREFHHFLGRVAPRHEEFHRWNEMTQVGLVLESIEPKITSTLGTTPNNRLDIDSTGRLELRTLPIVDTNVWIRIAVGSR